VNQLDKIMRGLEILKANDCEGIEADHDIIYANSHNELSPEDAELMDKYGWHFDDSLDTWCKYV
jgi:hypothetical protein